MKIFRKTMIAFAMVMAAMLSARAQTAKKDKQAAKLVELKKMIDEKNYVFTAQSVTPLRGGMRSLTTEYDLRIVPDSVIAYLPYFGRAYSAPINPLDGGIKFTSTKFSYTVEQHKNSNFDVIIIPQDTKDVKRLILSVSSGGYGTLSINSLNRDPISFYGYISPTKKKKDQ